MKNILSILITFFCLVAVAQAPQRFYTTFGGNGIDIGFSAKQTLDKQYIITGSTSSYGAGNTDVYLVKLDSMGQILWQKTFGGFANDVGKSVIQVPDSGYIVAGFTSSFGAGGYDAYILRTDKVGTLIWQKTFGGSDWDFAYDLVYTPDADIAVIGSTSSFGAGKKDGFVLKYDFLGNLIWHKEFGGVEDDELKSIIKTNDNFLATVGYTQSKGDINGDGYFLKLNLNGDTLFTKTFGAQYKDYANDLVQKASDDYVIAAAKTFSAGVDPESYMYCMTSTGNILWDNHYPSTLKNDGFVSVANSYHIPTYSAFIRTMVYFGSNQQSENFVAKIGGWGYLINSSGGSEKETSYSIEGTIDGGYVTVGTTESFGTVNGDVYFIKQDSTIINYSSVVGLKQNEKTIKPSIYLYEGIIHVNNLDIVSELKVFDLMGKLMKEVVFTKETEKINISNYSPSVYLVQLILKNGSTFTSKIIKNY